MDAPGSTAAIIINRPIKTFNKSARHRSYIVVWR